MTELTIVLSMINGLGQMALVAVFYGLIRRLDSRLKFRSAAFGLLFGAGAIVAMLTPAEVVPGVLVDTRAIMVGLAGAFAGVPAGLIAGALAAAFRFWLGGAGAPLGILSIAAAAAAGIGWLKLVRRRHREPLSGLLILGIAIAAHSVMALFNSRVDWALLSVYFPLIWTTCIVATMTLGWMMQRENRLILRERSLASFAYTDPLTGLANRRAFDRRMQNDDVSAPEAKFSIVIIDIDHFKQINDRFGHDAGDAVLCGLARAIEDEIRDNDLLARHGGEEFAVLLPGASLVEGRQVAERVRVRIAAEAFDFPVGQVTASFGVAAAANGVDQRGLMAAADAALYRAKAAGRDRVEVALAEDVPPGRRASQLPAPAPAR